MLPARDHNVVFLEVKRLPELKVYLKYGYGVYLPTIITDYHRNYAILTLNGAPPERRV
jgi:hypothetical protein